MAFGKNVTGVRETARQKSRKSLLNRQMTRRVEKIYPSLDIGAPAGSIEGIETRPKTSHTNRWPGPTPETKAIPL